MSIAAVQERKKAPKAADARDVPSPPKSDDHPDSTKFVTDLPALRLALGTHWDCVPTD